MLTKPIFIRVFTCLNISLVCVALSLAYKLFPLSELVPANVSDLEPLASLNSQPSIGRPTDALTAQPVWRQLIKHQATRIQGRYKGCLFGDSISQPLRTSLGADNFNFALSGMSTVSLIEQLKLLTAANLRCTKVIIAIGTNDAFYKISDRALSENLEQVIALVNKTRAEQITFIPAFYTSIAAERDPDMADLNERVREINVLIGKVGVRHSASVKTASTGELFINQALKENLTDDSVHLNQDGLEQYRLILLKIINNKK